MSETEKCLYEALKIAAIWAPHNHEPNADAERRAFEAWFIRWSNMTPMKTKDGRYVAEAHTTFCAWQAARADRSALLKRIEELEKVLRNLVNMRNVYFQSSIKDSTYAEAERLLEKS